MQHVMCSVQWCYILFVRSRVVNAAWEKKKLNYQNETKCCGKFHIRFKSPQAKKSVFDTRKNDSKTILILYFFIFQIKYDAFTLYVHLVDVL